MIQFFFIFLFLPVLVSLNGEPQIRICTTSKQEMDQCKKLQKLYGSNGILCKDLKGKASDVYECIQHTIKDSDVVVKISANEMITAKRSNLKLLISSDIEIKVALIVNPLKVNSITDLYQKNGCFLQALGAGSLLLAQHLMHFCDGELCEVDRLISKTFRAACYPGCRDPLVKGSFKIDCDRLCELCESTPDSETQATCLDDISQNYYAGTKGTIECLKNRGDAAVITIDSEAYLPMGMMVMCPNGTLVDSLTLVDDNCLLGKLPETMFAASSHQTALLLNEKTELLMQSLHGEGFHRVYNAAKLTQEEIIFNSIDTRKKPKEVTTAAVPILVVLLVPLIIVIIIGVMVYFFLRQRGPIFNQKTKIPQDDIPSNDTEPIKNISKC